MDDYRKTRSCTSKIIYTREKDVINAIKYMKKTARQKLQGNPHYYFCDYDRNTNPHWHIAHSKKRSKQHATYS